MKTLIDLPLLHQYRVEGNYFVPQEEDAERKITHYVEGRLMGVAITTEGEAVIHLVQSEGETDTGRVEVAITIEKALAVLRSLYSLYSRKKYRRYVVGLRVDQGVEPSVFYISRMAGRCFDIPAIPPLTEAEAYADSINDFLYTLEGTN